MFSFRVESPEEAGARGNYCAAGEFEREGELFAAAR